MAPPVNVFSNLPEGGRGIALFAVLFAGVLALVGLTVAATIIHCYMDPLLRRKLVELYLTPTDHTETILPIFVNPTRFHGRTFKDL